MTHRGLVTEGEDCEALVGSQPQVSKFPTRSVTAGCLFLFLSLSLYLSSGAPRHAESATLEIINAATKWTKFGEVPLSFELSGVECRLNKALNGQYDYQFQTADGRPVYKRTDEAGDHIYLFYDKECDGDRGGKSNMWGEFVLRYNPGQLSKTALSDVDRDHKCTSAAYTAYGSQGPTDRSRPYYHGKAGALPGKSVKWHVYCGPSTGLTIQTLRLSGHFAAPELKAKGAWQYVTTVKQGETRTESYGFDVSNSKGGAWDAGGEISGEVAVEIQGGLPFVGGEKVEAKMTAEARSSMERSWSQAVNSGSKLTRKIPFKDGGGALWQWHFVVQGDSKSITFPANDFALTKNGMEQPQCYPSLSLDGWKYQKCVPGGHL